jgi:membrane-bound ClpP family serine protease
MTFLIDPNIACFFLITAVMFFLLMEGLPKSRFLKIGMVICLVAAGLELTQLKTNPWALILVAVSPVPYVWTLRQPRPQSILAFVTILMLAAGCSLLFWQGDTTIDVLPVAALFSFIYGRILLLVFIRVRDNRKTRLSDHSDSLIGLVGTAKSNIDKYEPGMVELDDEVWVACSKYPIAAGSRVRIIRFDGMYLIVEKLNNVSGTKVP